MKLLEKNYFLRKLYFDKSELEQVLILSCLFSVSLSLARIIYTHQWLFVSFNWNLFLAFVPYFISRWLTRNPAWTENKVKFLAAFICWLLFIPNSFYIITDLFHLEERYAIPLWFDLALILSFAWNGILLGILSVRQMEKILETKFFLKNEWFFVFPIMLLNAFGIYLGRVLRYNSWDVISNPFHLVHDVVYLLAHPIRNRFDWSMILCYAVFMMLIYITIKKLGKAVW